MKAFVAAATSVLLPAVCQASPTLGPVMFLGDSITVGADGSNSGYRGYLVGDLLNDGLSFSTIGTTQQNASNYLLNLTTPGTYNPYIQNEGHSGASIEDLYSAGPNPADTNEIATVAFNQAASTPGYTPQEPYGVNNPYVAPKYVYLMIGSNNSMNSPSQIAQNLSDELSLIGYIKSVDTNLADIFVEPPPSYPSASEGNAPNGYDTFSADLDAALQQSPYSSFTTFVNSRPELNSAADFALENGNQQYLHPSDAGYQIIATDLYNATLASVPEPAHLGFVGSLGCLLLLRTRRR